MSGPTIVTIHKVWDGGPSVAEGCNGNLGSGMMHERRVSAGLELGSRQGPNIRITHPLSGTHSLAETKRVEKGMCLMGVITRCIYHEGRQTHMGLSYLSSRSARMSRSLRCLL